VTARAATAELAARAQAAARGRWPGATIDGLTRLPGGISSLTFAARLAGTGAGARRVVIKVAPPGLEPVRNRDVLRQARVLRALHPVAGVNVPEVLCEDDGQPPLFVMAYVPGEAYEPKWDHADAPPAPAVVATRALAAAAMLARLHGVTPAQIGLGDERALTPGEELERWAALYATAGDDLRGDERSLAGALGAWIPEPLAPRVLHGDYRLGNMQFQGGRLAAIIDWEIWSVGDPRNDLAWLMMYCDPIAQRVDRRDPANQAAADAMPVADVLLAEYVRAGGTPPRDLRWFGALCRYKLGAAMAVLAKRNRRAPDPDPGLELAAQTTPAMLAHALASLTGAPATGP
jgi:aminoglycoside phosphotransferase (APT) family kinase protein